MDIQIDVCGFFCIWTFFQDLKKLNDVFSGTTWNIVKICAPYCSWTKVSFSHGASHLTFVVISELQPRMRGWLLASVDSKVGIIPANYVKILGKRRGTKSSARVQHQNDTTSPPSGEMSTAASANVGISQKLQKPNERSGDDLQVDPIEAAFYQNNGDPHCPDPINTQPGQFNSGKTRLSDQAKPDMLDSDSGNFEDNW